MKKFLLGFVYLLCLSFVLIFPHNLLAAEEEIKLQLQIPLGGLSEMTISGTSIGDYIKAVFTFASSAVVVLAIVMIIVGGIRWILSGGDSGKIGQAKSTIIKALLGLFIAIFAVFILQTVSPGTVTFQPISPPEKIAGQYCCRVTKDGKFAYEFKTQSECNSITGGGSKVDTKFCQGEIEPFNLAQICGGNDSLARCFAEQCNTGSAARYAPLLGYLCKDPALPNCCKRQGALPVCTAANASSVCNAFEYCGSSSGGTGAGDTGYCLPKRPNGRNCMEKILGTTTGDIARGGPNEVCLSGHCSGATAAGLNKCVPAKNTGVENDFCDDSSECKNYTDKGGLFCACPGWKPSAEEKGPGCLTGTCAQKGWYTFVCQGWGVNSLDMWVCGSYKELPLWCDTSLIFLNRCRQSIF